MLHISSDIGMLLMNRKLKQWWHQYRGRRGHDHMVVGFATSCAISAYHY
jgi:hypothetical protein